MESNLDTTSKITNNSRVPNRNPKNRGELLPIFRPFDTIGMALLYLNNLNSNSYLYDHHRSMPIRRYELPFTISFCHKLTLSGQPANHKCTSVVSSSNYHCFADDSECGCSQVSCDLSMPLGMGEEYYYSLIYGHVANEVDSWRQLMYYVSSPENQELYSVSEIPALIQYLSMHIARMFYEMQVKFNTCVDYDCPQYIGGMVHLFSFKICIGDIAMKKTRCTRCWRPLALLWGHPSQWNNHVTHSLTQLQGNTVMYTRPRNFCQISQVYPDLYTGPNGSFVPIYDIFGNFQAPPMISVSEKLLNKRDPYCYLYHNCSKSSLVVDESETSLRDRSPYLVGCACVGK